MLRSTHSARWQIIPWLLLGCGAITLRAQSPMLPDQPAVRPGGDVREAARQGLAALAEGRDDEAAKLLVDAASVWLLTDVDSATAGGDQDLGRQVLIGAGQALRRLGKNDRALRHFERALAISTSLGEQVALRVAIARCQLETDQAALARAQCDALLSLRLNADQRMVVDQLLVAVALAEGNLAEARQRFDAATADPLAVTEHAAHWALLAERMGTRALAARESEMAETAFAWVLSHAPEDFSRETASLGIAWALTQRGDYSAASERFEAFLQTFPESPHRGRARLIFAGCLRRVGEDARAEAELRGIANETPGSAVAAKAVLESIRLQGVRPLDVRFIETLRQMLAAEAVDPAVLATALVTAAASDDGTLWDAAFARFVEHRQAGEWVGAALAGLSAVEREQAGSRAEGLAIAMLQRTEVDDSLPYEPGFEAIMRWIAAEGAWEVGAEAVGPAAAFEQRGELSTVSLRLLSESLLRSGRRAAARDCLEQLVTERQDTDFFTLLRRAELSVELDSKRESGERVAEVVGMAAGGEQVNLARMLEAQWAIRAARLDVARTRLGEILADEESDPQLRPRAQWLIGETHFLQRDFAAAIEAYRKVEPLDQEGIWTPLALVQAGRSFEQLGRTREARLCYRGLLQKFGESSPADVARTRLAELGDIDKQRR
jgi:TolA-binding protein